MAKNRIGLKKKAKSGEKDLLKILIDAILEKKGKDPVVIDLRKLEHAACDYFIICHGDSTTSVNAIAESIEEFAIHQAGARPRSVEGKQVAHWIAIDFFTIVAHVFLKEQRMLYQLEDLWSDGKIKKIKEQ